MFYDFLNEKILLWFSSLFSFLLRERAMRGFGDVKFNEIGRKLMWRFTKFKVEFSQISLDIEIMKVAEFFVMLDILIIFYNFLVK